MGRRWVRAVCAGALVGALSLGTSGCLLSSSNPGAVTLERRIDGGEDRLVGVDETARREKARHDLEAVLVVEKALPKDWKQLPEDQRWRLDDALRACDGSVMDLTGAPTVVTGFGHYDTGAIGTGQAKGEPTALVLVRAWEFPSSADAARFVADVSALFSACTSPWVDDVDHPELVTTLAGVAGPAPARVESDAKGQWVRTGGIGDGGVRIAKVSGPSGDPPHRTLTAYDFVVFGDVVVLLARSTSVPDAGRVELTTALDLDDAAKAALCDTARGVAAMAEGEHELSLCAPVPTAPPEGAPVPTS